MKAIASRMGTTLVLALTGRLDSDAAPAFEQECQEAIGNETGTVIFDLTALEYLSSAGLRTVLSAGKAAQARGGNLVLCVPKGLNRQILEASGFHKLFPLCETLEEAGKHSIGNFKIHVHKEWEVNVMTVYGRVDAEHAPELENAGRKLLDTPYQRLLINLSNVQYLSSAGLCALLNLGKLADAKHGGLVLCSPAAPVRQILKMSGFDKILTIRDSVQAAIVG